MPTDAGRAGTPAGVFGAELRFYRTRAGLPQKDLAAKATVLASTTRNRANNAAPTAARLADQLMDQLTVPAQGDLVDQFTRDVSFPQRRRGLVRLFRGHPQVRLAAR